MRTRSSRALRLAVATAVVIATPLVFSSRSEAEPVPVVRTGGQTRTETAALISASSWRDGAGTALLARSDAYPDALSAAPLAAELDAPLLLTHPRRLEPAVADELDRLDVDTVVLLGGDGALSTDVESAVRARGITTRRIKGATRFATSAAIADELRARTGTAEGSYVARATNGKGWADALGAAPLAGRQGRPLLLADFATLPYPSGWLADHHPFTLVGGEGVLDPSLMTAMTGLTGLTETPDVADTGAPAFRVSGKDRYMTSLALADRALDDLAARDRGKDGVQVWITTGRNFPDALAAGPAVARRDAVLLLAPPNWYDSPVRSWIADRADRISEIRLLGARSAVPDDVLADLARMDPEQPETLLPPDAVLQLAYSTRADLSGGRPLEGATVSGEIHVFLAECDRSGACVPAP